MQYVVYIRSAVGKSVAALRHDPSHCCTKLSPDIFCSAANQPETAGRLEGWFFFLSSDQYNNCIYRHTVRHHIYIIEGFTAQCIYIDTSTPGPQETLISKGDIVNYFYAKVLNYIIIFLKPECCRDNNAASKELLLPLLLFKTKKRNSSLTHSILTAKHLF